MPHPNAAPLPRLCLAPDPEPCFDQCVGSPGAGGCVFILSGDSAVGRSLEILLWSAGFEVKACGSAFALAAAASGRDRCCLVIDHHMPGGIDGLWLVEHLPHMGLSMPTIIVDEIADPGFCRRATAAGAMAVLAKPLFDDRILQTVAAAIGCPAEARQASGFLLNEPAMMGKARLHSV